MSKTSTQWQKANLSYQNYIDYILSKPEKYELTFIDLLYISNFKGGNASIHEKEISVNAKLKKYSECLKTIHKEFDNKQLRDLSKEELASLKRKTSEFVNLTSGSSTAIDGVKSSYASALLHFYFPNLIPILDRRVLNGTGIKKVKKGEQVKDIEKYYPELIENFYRYLQQNHNKSLRDYDRENFIKPVQDEEAASA